jgi:hypothetical protein
MNYRIIRLLFSACLLTALTPLNAQKDSGKVGITVSSLGINNIKGESTNREENWILEGKNFYTLGLNYTKGLNKWLELEVGIEYSKHNISLGVTDLFETHVFMRAHKTELSLIGIPAMLKANFLKYFFVNGGLLIDIDVSPKNIYMNDQTGFGLIAGVGANYSFEPGLSVFLNPYIKAHSLININNLQRVLEAGFRLGFAFDMSKLCTQQK